MTHGADSFGGDMRVEGGAQRWQVQVAVTLRNCLPASIIPAAHQRSAMVPFCHFHETRDNLSLAFNVA